MQGAFAFEQDGRECGNSDAGAIRFLHEQWQEDEQYEVAGENPPEQDGARTLPDLTISRKSITVDAGLGKFLASVLQIKANLADIESITFNSDGKLSLKCSRPIE